MSAERCRVEAHVAFFSRHIVAKKSLTNKQINKQTGLVYLFACDIHDCVFDSPCMLMTEQCCDYDDIGVSQVS